MRNTAKDYINRIKKPEHTKVIFRYEGYGNNAHMDIDDFLQRFGHRLVSFNGDFYDSNGIIMNAFIKKTA